MGLVLPASRHRVYLSYLPPRLGILSSPPYITTNSHPSSTHLLNTNLLLLSLSLSLKHTEIHTQKTTRYRRKNKQPQVLLLLGVSICTFWHSVLSLSLICVCHWQISPLFPFAKIPISGSGSVYLSLTHTDIHTQDPTKYRRTQQQRQTLLLGVPISTFWHSFLSLSLCVYHWRFSPLYLFAKIPISCSFSVSLTYIGDCKVICTNNRRKYQ